MGNKKLILIGDTAFAEVAYEYFTHDSPYDVVAFAVEREYLKQDLLCGLPVVAVEDMEQLFEPASYHFFVAATYTQLNRLRTRLYLQLKGMGYIPASYISSRAFVWHNVSRGEHCFIFEDNTVQPYVMIGDNVVIWSGNHIGHHSTIGDNCFIASHSVISGFCNIGRNCFLGVNSTLANNITIGDDTWVGPGVTICSDTVPGSLFGPRESEPSRVSSLRFFKVRQ